MESATNEGRTPAWVLWRWLAPAIGYAVVVGLIGITTKLTLDHLRWEEMFVWAATAYAVIAIVLVTAFGVRLDLNRGAIFAALSGLFAASGLFFLYLALTHGDAGQVVPITASYPVLTAAVAALVLAERITAIRIVGTLLVVAGVAVIGTE